MILEDLIKCRESTLYTNIFKKERWLTTKEAYVLYALLQEHKIQRYIECGTANGFSAAVAFSALETEDLHTWDVVERPKVWDVISGIIKPNCYVEPFSPNAREKISALPVVLRKAFFIDGNHHRKVVKEDWRTARRNMTEKDIVIFHDTTEYEGIAEIVYNISTYDIYIVSHIKTERGMAVIRKWPL